MPRRRSPIGRPASGRRDPLGECGDCFEDSCGLGVSGIQLGPKGDAFSLDPTVNPTGHEITVEDGGNNRQEDE
jgi:hypothetical protein